jgi:hypothetical protein
VGVERAQRKGGRAEETEEKVKGARFVFNTENHKSDICRIFFLVFRHSQQLATQRNKIR